MSQKAVFGANNSFNTIGNSSRYKYGSSQGGGTSTRVGWVSTKINGYVKGFLFLSVTTVLVKILMNKPLQRALVFKVDTDVFATTIGVVFGLPSLPVEKLSDVVAVEFDDLT